MPVCEKCWADAWMRARNHPMKSHSEHYHDLLEERKNNPCTEAQQRGEYEDVGVKRTPPNLIG